MSQTRAAHAPLGLEKCALDRPRTLRDACELLAASTSKGERTMLLAGGTDFVVDRHLMPVEKAAPLDRIVDLSGVGDFHSITETSVDGETRLRFGGGVTYWDLRQCDMVARGIPMLAVMARDVGAVQIQTRGTLAGNVASASPAADGVAALLALEATLHLQSAKGSRSVPLAQALVGYRKTVIQPAEIIAAICVRVPASGAHVRWRKVGTRLAQAISKVALASVVESDAAGAVTRARFGMASVAAVTHGLPSVQAYVLGKRPSSDAAFVVALDRAIEADIKPIDDVRSTGDYRLHVAKALVRQALGLE